MNCVYSLSSSSTSQFRGIKWRYRFFISAFLVCVFTLPFAAAGLYHGRIYRAPETVPALLTIGIITLAAAIALKPEKQYFLYLRGFSSKETNRRIKATIQSSIARHATIVSIMHFSSNPLMPLGVSIPTFWILAVPSILIYDATDSYLPIVLAIALYTPLARMGLAMHVWRITDPDKLENLTRRIRKHRRPTSFKRLQRTQNRFLPSAIIAKTSDEMWQLAVARIAELSSAIIIDITSPGPGLYWEISYMCRTHPNKVILVSEIDYSNITPIEDESNANAVLAKSIVEAVGTKKVLVRQRGLFTSRRFKLELGKAAADLMLRNDA